tara:strand:+ start:559 stop:1395 length:837 start_codon:yes stop_codon:yes gene_type:complete
MNIFRSNKPKEFTPDREVRRLMKQVHEHPIFSALTDERSLSLFMSHHVYAVWDFMSLVKSVQAHVAPCTIPWIPGTDNSVVKAINEIVLSEESDVNMNGTGSCSHYELYLESMKEIGVPITDIVEFVENVRCKGLSEVISYNPNHPAYKFVGETFKTIIEKDPLIISCWFAYGREKIIPGMFTSALSKLGMSRQQAPHFYYYLERHTELDGDEHSHFAQQLVDHFCKQDESKIKIAQSACKEAIKVRIQFWDGVLEAIKSSKLDIQKQDDSLIELTAV